MPAMSNQPTLQQLLTDGQLAAFEERWLEVFSDPPPAEALAGVLDDAVLAIHALRSGDQNDLAASLIDVVPEDIEKNSPPDTRLAFAQVLADCAPEDPSLRRRLRDAYRARYKGRRGLDSLLDLAGLYKDEVEPRSVIEMMNQLLPYEVDVVIRHSSWGTGKIKKVDRFTAELVIDFASRKNHRMAADAAVRGLEVLAEDDFDAQAFADPEGIREMIKKEPLKALKMVVKTLGGRSDANQIREKLRGSYLDQSKWSAWWTRAKKLALADPYVEVTEERPVKLALREEAKSFIDEVIEQIRSTKRFQPRWEIARRYLKHSTDGADRIWAELAPALSRSLDEHDVDDYPQLLDAAIERGAPLDAFIELSTLEQLWITLSQNAQRILGEEIRAKLEKWTEMFGSVLWRDGCRLRPWIRKTLREEAPGLLSSLDSSIVQDPTRFPERFLSLADNVLNERWVPSDATSDPLELVIDLMVLVRSFERGRSASKDFVRPAMKLLTDDECAWVQRVIVEAEEPRVARAARLLHGSESLDRILYHVGPALNERLPDHHLEVEKPFWEEAELLVSRKSLEARRKQVQEMMEKEMPEVEKQIGHAASFGDLSENSEWSAAIERRNQLVERIERMRRELSVAQMIDNQPIDADLVCPGTRVELKRLDIEEADRAVTILGPWDVDVEQGILSYHSPLAAGLLGHVQGDEVNVVLPEGSATYRVLEIERAL